MYMMFVTHRYVMMAPWLLGDGPPARIVMFQPVWAMRDWPIVEGVYGSFLIALEERKEKKLVSFKSLSSWRVTYVSY
jgi:hypothetical protein